MSGSNKKKLRIQKNEYILGDVRFSFHIGDEINPGWDVIFGVFKRIYTYGYTELVPKYFERDKLFSCTKEEAAWVVPFIVQEIDKGFESGRYNIAENEILAVLGYILVWFWYRNFQGPKPAIEKLPGTRKAFVKWHADLECPFCHKRYVPPASYKNWDSWNAEKRFKAWLRWLPKHASDYHKWDV